jgi:hypothetical protein
MKVKNPIPKTKEAWLKEIVRAFVDARETIPFGKLVGESIGQKDLFHFAPDVCLKFRGIKRTKRIRDKALEAALSSYVATKDVIGEVMDAPQISFAFCYLASQFGLGILDESIITDVMDYVENNKETIITMTEAEA